MPSYLITGTSRGLGLAFTKELLKNKNNVVIATARSTAKSAGLQELKAQDKDDRLILLDLDVSEPQSINKAVQDAGELLPNGLDNLINNAGVMVTGLKTFDELEPQELLSELNLAVNSALLVIRAFLPLLRKGQSKRILVLTSLLGSLELAPILPDLSVGYSISKAALNMLVRKWTPILKGDGIAIAIMNPGWVKATDLGEEISGWMGKNLPDSPPVSIETSAEGVIKVLNGLTVADTGDFYSYDGSKVPF